MRAFAVSLVSGVTRAELSPCQIELSYGARKDVTLFVFDLLNAECALNVKAHLTKVIRIARTLTLHLLLRN